MERTGLTWKKIFWLTMCTAIIAFTCLPTAADSRPIKKDRNNGEERNREDKPNRPKKDRGMKNFANRNKTNRAGKIKSKMCNHEALRRCGRSTVNEYENRTERLGKLPFASKCKMREAFFRCVEMPRQKKCRQHHQHKNRVLLKRVSEFLWSTRGCLLGVDM